MHSFVLGTILGVFHVSFPLTLSSLCDVGAADEGTADQRG